MKFSPALIIAVFAFLWSASQASALPGRAEVKKVTGKATVAKGGGAAITLAEGMVLGTGDTIATGANSTVDLDLGLNGDVLRVEPDSTLLLDQLEVVSAGNAIVNTKLDVTKGDVTANVINKLSKASKYEVRTPGGVAGIRGTIYNASVTAGMSVIHGAVSWTPAGGLTVNVYTGQGAGAGTASVRALGRAIVNARGASVTSATAAVRAAQTANTVNTITQAIATQAAYAVMQAGGSAAQAAAAAASAAQEAMTQIVTALQTAYPNNPTPLVQSIVAEAGKTIVAAAAVGAATGVAAGGGTAAAAAAAAQTALNTAAQATGTTVTTQTQTSILAVATTAAVSTVAAVAGGGDPLAAITATVTTSAATTTQTVTTSTGTGGGDAVTVVANPLNVSTSN